MRMGAAACGGAVVDIPNVSAGDSQADPGPATASFEFERDGDVFTQGLLGSQQLADWVANAHATIGDGYWIRVTLTAGDALDTGTAGSWLQLSSDRTFGYSQSGLGSKSGTFTIEIATDSGGSNIVDTRAGVTLDAEVF